MDEPYADGENGRERTTPAFDSVAGMRAAIDVQAEGLRAAGDLLERVLRSEPEEPGSPSRAPAADYTALLDAWTNLVRRTVAALAGPGESGAVMVPIDSSGVQAPVRVEVRASGGADGAATEIWLHNGTFAAVGPLALRCGQLTDSDGAVLDGADVCFEPREVGALPARSSRAVVLSLTANGSLRPGTYRGTIQAQGAPRVWLPLEVAIKPW